MHMGLWDLEIDGWDLIPDRMELELEALKLVLELCDWNMRL